MSRTVMPSVAAPNPDVKKIRLYRNGDVNFNGKDLVFNRRQVKTIDRLLQTATEHVDLNRAARSIHTPRHGTTVKNIDEITDRESYVVVGQGSKFRHLNYGMLDGRFGSRTLDRKRPPAELETIRVVEHSPIRVPGRMYQSIVDVIPIYVYCNGNDQEPPKRILLTENMFRQQNAKRSWEMILAEISRHVQPQYTATTQLYTLDGTPLRHRSEITAGKEFVAVSYKAPFRQMNYVLAGTKPAFNVSPRIIRRNLTNGAEPYYRQHRPARTNYSSDEDSLSYVDSSSMPPLSTQSDPVIQKNRPYRYDYRIVYADGRSVFPTKTTARPFKYQEPLPAIADDRGDEGVFKARTARVETNSAKEVEDNGPQSERRYADNKKMRTSRLDAEAAYDDKLVYDRYRANAKPKTSRTEVERADDVNENVQPAYVTRRTNPTVKNSRTETEEMREVNGDEPMSDAERQIHENNHRDEDRYDTERNHNDPDGHAIRRRTTSRDVQRRQSQDHYQPPQQRQQSKRSKVSNRAVTPKRRSDAGRQVVKCGATVEVQCSHDNEYHRMDYGSEVDDDEEGRRKHQVPVLILTTMDDNPQQKSTHFIFIADDDEEGDNNRRESSKDIIGEDQEPAADDTSARNKTPDLESGQNVSDEPLLLDNDRQETPKVDVDEGGEPAAEDTSARNKTPDLESGQNVSDEPLLHVIQVPDNDRLESPKVDVEGDMEPAANDTSAGNKTPDLESGQNVLDEQSLSESHAPDVERRESSKAGESYRDNEEQNVVEESEDNVNQQDADKGDRLENTETDQEDAKVINVDDDSGQKDDRFEREAATKIQAAYKGYTARKRLREERLQKDLKFDAADATVEEDTAAAITA